MADVPPARLAEIMPGRWHETRQRVVSIRRLLREEDQSGPTIMRYANELGVSRQMIYKLIGIVKAWDASGDAPAAPPRWSPHDPVADALIRDAASDLGAGAIAARVHERAAELAKARSLPAPGVERVYTAMGRRPAGTALALRLSLDGGIILDAARMAVTLASEDEPPRPATLLAAFHLGRGELIAWTVERVLVTSLAVDRLLTGLEPAGDTGLLATSAIPIDGHPELRRAPRRVRSGSVVRAALGASLGRVRLLAGKPVDDELARVSLRDLREVLGSVLAIPEVSEGGD